jgi:glycosyltransferase involved in cell wall biosynthesis
MIHTTPKRYLSKLYKKLKTAISHERYSVVINVNGVDEYDYKKIALLVYIVRPFQLRDEDPELYRHQQLKQCKQIAAILGESGYIVDVVDIRNWLFRPYRDYDLVISNRVADIHLKKDAVRIYLATTLYHKLHNRNLSRRHKLLNERRGYRVKRRRIYAEAMPYVERSDAIVGFGNEFTMSSWREAFNIPVYPFNNFGYKHTEFNLKFKDFSEARKNFLFLASRSQTQKGLDLLLEVFPKHPALHLYICSAYNSERDFSVCYHKELYETDNIHPIGWVRVNSPEYNELVRKCAFVVLPSCSEGQSGSVVQCMYSGLIPLVTREAGIDTEDFGLTFADDSLEEIEKVILDVSQRPETWHKEHSIRTREVSEQKYSEDAFMNRWRSILGEILKNAGNKSKLLTR